MIGNTSSSKKNGKNFEGPSKEINNLNLLLNFRDVLADEDEFNKFGSAKSSKISREEYFLHDEVRDQDQEDGELPIKK